MFDLRPLNLIGRVQNRYSASLLLGIIFNSLVTCTVYHCIDAGLLFSQVWHKITPINTMKELRWTEKLMDHMHTSGISIHEVKDASDTWSNEELSSLWGSRFLITDCVVYWFLSLSETETGLWAPSGEVGFLKANRIAQSMPSLEEIRDRAASIFTGNGFLEINRIAYLIPNFETGLSVF